MMELMREWVDSMLMQVTKGIYIDSPIEDVNNLAMLTNGMTVMRTIRSKSDAAEFAMM